MEEMPIVLDISIESNIVVKASEKFNRGEFSNLQIALIQSGAEIASFEVVGRKIALEFKSENESNVTKIANAVANFVENSP